MKHAILFIVFLVQLTAVCNAQLNLPQFNKEKFAINKKAFIVLGAWSAANIITGAIGQSSSTGQAKYFYQMNMLWGGVNLLLAVPGYIGARKGATDLPMGASVRSQAVIEKTFAFNAGLDLAYIAGGAWVMEKGNGNSNPDKLKGYGKSIILQGAALLLFDAVMFTTHNHHGKKLMRILDAVQLAPNSLGMRVGI